MKNGPNDALATAAVVVTLATILSRLLGFVREATIAGVYGAGPEVDAYLIAQSVPNVLIALLSTAVVTSMLPTLSADLATGRPDRAQQTFNSVGTAIMVALLPAVIVLWLGADTVVGWLAPGFGSEAAVLASRLARIVIPASVLIAATNVLAALLHAHRRFTWPALEGLPFNIVMIGAAGLFGMTFGIRALAVGFVVGSAGRLLMQIVGLRGTGARIRPALALGTAQVRQTAGLVPTVVLSHVISNINNLVDRIVGSTLAAGSIATLGFGYRLVALPHGLLTQALVTVIFPSLSARLASGDPGASASLLRRAMRALVVLLAPVVVILILQADQVVTVVYGRGQFDVDDTALTTLAVIGFAPGLVAAGVRDLALRGMYAAGQRRLPLVVAVTGGVANVVGDVTLGPVFGVAGLAVATSLSQAMSAVLAVGTTGVLRGRVATMRRQVGAVVLAVIVSSTSGWVAGLLLQRTARLVEVFATAGVVVTTHMLILWLVDRSVLQDLAAPVARRMRR